MTPQSNDEPSTHTAPRPDSVSAYQLFMLVLSAGVILTLLAEAILPLSAATRAVLATMDNVVASIFLLDFFVCLARAPAKLGYLVRWGWIDLLASLPTVDALRWGRGARMIRIVRLARGLRSTRELGALVLARRTQCAFMSALLLVLLCLTFGSITVLHLEADTETGIHNADDALWWACVTLITVGYGDVVPATTGGRLVGVALMVAGLVLLGTMSGLFASWFLAADHRPQKAPSPAGPPAQSEP